MSFRNRSRSKGLSLRPVNRIKHVVDIQAGVSLGVQSNHNLAFGTDNPVQSTTIDCQTGATINGIYLKVECYARTAGALATAYMMVMKNPGGNLTFTNANVQGISDNKKYVIHQEMVMLNRQVNGNPRTLFNGVIVLPRGYRRLGPNDLLQLQVFSPGVDLDLCIQCHYKEFR